MIVEVINSLIGICESDIDNFDTNDISDGSHTFEELYFHRMILFSIILRTHKSKSWRSRLHNDGTMYKDYFIVGIDTPEGQYTYHYHVRYWSNFKDIEEIDRAPEYDGHKSSDITRLFSLL